MTLTRRLKEHGIALRAPGFELSRNKRCAYDFNKLLASTKRQIGADFIRQYNNCSRHKLSGWYKPRNNESSYLHMVPSCKKLNRHTSQISARLHELSSRCSQSHSGQVRMDSASSQIHLPRCGPRSPHNGQIHVGNDRTLSALQQLVSRPTYKQCRRLAPNRLASTQQLRECTLPTAEQSNKHCVRPKGPGHNNRPWWPAQTQFQRLRRLSVCPPIKLPKAKYICFPLLCHIPEPVNNPRWKLYAWRVNGNLD